MSITPIPPNLGQTPLTLYSRLIGAGNVVAIGSNASILVEPPGSNPTPWLLEPSNAANQANPTDPTYSASTATLDLPDGAGVLRAFLVWSVLRTAPSASDTDTIYIRYPGQTGSGLINANAFTAEAKFGNTKIVDISTSLADNGGLSGTYTVLNPNDNLDPTGLIKSAWSLYVFYTAPGEAVRQFSIWVGEQTVAAGQSASFPVTGFPAAPIGPITGNFASTVALGTKGLPDTLSINGIALGDQASDSADFVSNINSDRGALSNMWPPIGYSPTLAAVDGFQTQTVALTGGEIPTGSGSNVVTATNVTENDLWLAFALTYNLEEVPPPLPLIRPAQPFVLGPFATATVRAFSVTQGNYTLNISFDYLYPTEPLYPNPTANRLVGSAFQLSIGITPVSGYVPVPGDTISFTLPPDLFTAMVPTIPDVGGNPAFTFATTAESPTVTRATFTVAEVFASTQLVTLDNTINPTPSPQYYVYGNTHTFPINFGSALVSQILSMDVSTVLTDRTFNIRTVTPVANGHNVRSASYNMFVWDATANDYLIYPLGGTNPTLVDTDNDAIIPVGPLPAGKYLIKSTGSQWGYAVDEQPGWAFLVDIGGSILSLSVVHIAWYGTFANLKWSPTTVFTILKQDQNGVPVAGASFTIYDDKGAEILTTGPTGADGRPKTNDGRIAYYWIQWHDVVRVLETTLPPGATNPPIDFLVTNAGFNGATTLTSTIGTTSIAEGVPLDGFVLATAADVLIPPGIVEDPLGSIPAWVITAVNAVPLALSSFTLQKQDPDGNPLDATFELFDGASPGSTRPVGTPILTFTTVGGAYASPAILTVDAQYTIFESVPPPGFLPDDNRVFTATTAPIALTMINGQIAPEDFTSFSLRKQDVSGAPLDATFELFVGAFSGVTRPLSSPILTFTTAGGQYQSDVILDVGTIYTLFESGVPRGFARLANAVFTATLPPAQLVVVNALSPDMAQVCCDPCTDPCLFNRSTNCSANPPLHCPTQCPQRGRWQPL